jgi:PKD domain-containing protein
MIARWLSAGGRVPVAVLAGLIMAGGACTRMPLTAPTKSTIQLSAAPTVPLNGSVDVIATVIEGSGTPVQNGTLVSFTATLGRMDPTEARTENGKVTVRFLAGAQSGMATVTALSGAATGTATGTDSETTAPLGATVNIKVGGAAAKTVTLRADPATVPNTGGTVTLTAVVVDENGGALSGVPVAFAASAGHLQASSVNTNTSGEASTTLTTPGPATVTATAGAVTSEPVEITVAALPTISLSASPNPATSGQAVTFSINVDTTKAVNPVRNVRIEFGDGDFEDLGAVTGGTTASHVYNNDGAYTVKVTVTDSAGQQATQVLGLTVLPKSPVSVTLTLTPSPGTVGAAVSFTAAVTMGAGVTADRFDWVFGDGTTATTTGASTTKIYTAAGTFHTKVTVHASDGSSGVGAADIQINP